MSGYHKMSLAEKQAYSRGRIREPSVVCPDCETQLLPADLLAHMERCEGPREPHPSSSWVTWREALALGILKGTLSRWVARGLVRHRGELQDRRYLLRDLVRMMASRRRKIPDGNRPLDRGGGP